MNIEIDDLTSSNVIFFYFSSFQLQPTLLDFFGLTFLLFFGFVFVHNFRPHLFFFFPYKVFFTVTTKF